MSSTGSNQAVSSAPSSTDDRQAIAKLEALKEVRGKTIGLEKVRLRLLHDIEALESEERCIQEYRREMELLQQEKMAHVEELRQIHADINAMETVLKQADESKRQVQDSAKRLIEEYGPLKHDVDLMRTELLGLERLPDLAAEDVERLGAAGLLDKPKPSNPWQTTSTSSSVDGGANDTEREKAGAAAAARFFGLRGAAAIGQGQGHNSHPNPFLAAAAAQHQVMGLGPLGSLGAKADQLRTSLSAQASGPSSVPSPFRQQPPPMKSCLSCHQQIHRNAPICPLCKAKSRSRNPKKPKKKD